MPKKKNAAMIIEEKNMILIQIISSCEVYKNSGTCPVEIKSWFDHLSETARKGL
jgi:hypothetical protein